MSNFVKSLKTKHSLLLLYSLVNNVTSTEVSVYTVPNDLPWKWGEDGSEAQFQTYLSFPATLGGKYDLIMNDGRARLEVR